MLILTDVFITMVVVNRVMILITMEQRIKINREQRKMMIIL